MGRKRASSGPLLLSVRYVKLHAMHERRGLRETQGALRREVCCWFLTLDEGALRRNCTACNS